MSKKLKGDKNKKEISEEESELEYILDEEKVKELAKEIGEDDNLEVEFDDKSFSETIQLSESTAPVLEQIAGQQQLGRIFFSQGIGGDEEEKEIKYIPSKYNESSEKNYKTRRDEEFQGISVQQPVHLETGTRRNEELRGVNPTNTEIQELRNNPEKTQEQYFATPEKVNENRNLPFESKRERKYKL